MIDLLDAPVERALLQLLGVWSKKRDPSVADTIDVLSRALGTAPLAGEHIFDKLQAFDEAVKDPLRVGAALAAFPIGTIEDGTKQLKKLSRIDDPRVPKRIVDTLEDPPFRSHAALAFWRQALALVVESGDVRAHAPRVHHRDRVEGEFAPPMGRLVRQAIEAVLPLITRRADVVAGARDLLTKLEERHQADRLSSELLAALYEDPHDLGSRLVYADRLLEAGDPRGELIVLQAAEDPTPAQKKRTRSLLKAHAFEWLGDLQPVLLKSGLVYENGFLFLAHPRRIRRSTGGGLGFGGVCQRS